MTNDKIIITIQDKEDFFDKFNSFKLSEELGTYLYNQSLKFPLKRGMKIYIKYNFNLTDEEKENIKMLVNDYFKNNLKEIEHYYKFNNLKKFILFILGIIFIFISNIWEVNNDFLISEVFLIVGWVAIWEVVDNVLLTETKRKYKYKHLKKILKSEIVFESEKM